MTLHYATRMNDEAHGHAQGHGDPLGLALTGRPHSPPRVRMLQHLRVVPGTGKQYTIGSPVLGP